MELKKFRNKYDLELIPAAGANIILGTLVWDPFLGKPKFDHPGMPNNIFNAFLDANLVNETEWSSFLDDLKTVELMDAHFAESIINVDKSIASSLEYPTIGKIENAFELAQVSKFSFGELKVRTMPNITRVRIDDYLEELKKNRWEEYDGRIRKVFMITELYYGSIKLITKREFKDELEASIPHMKLELSNSIESGRSIEYTFSHQNVPFAMRLEKVKDFNG